MPKVTQEHIDARRRQILEAAFRTFSRQGFRQTTVRDICREAGLSIGAVYGHFESKEAIVTALAEVGQENTRRFLESITAEGSAPETLVTLLGKMVDGLESDQGQASARLDLRLRGEALDIPRLRDLFRQGFRSARLPIVQVLRRAQEEGRVLPDIDTEAVANVFVALFLGVSEIVLLEPDADSRSFVAVVEALLGALGTRDAPGEEGP